MNASQLHRQQSACSGKDPLTDFHHAKRVAKRMHRRYGSPMQPYRCQHCHHWHVGEHLKNPKDRRKHQEPG